MNSRFKEQLFSLGGNRAARQYMAHFRLDAAKLAAFGSYGETGDNYYLYIYRDFFTAATKYQALLFLYRAFELETPLQVIYTDKDMDMDRQRVYIEAAVHYVKKNCRPSITPGLHTKAIYDEMQESIAAHQEKEKQNQQAFEETTAGKTKREISVQVLDLKEPDENYYTPYVYEHFDILKGKPRNKDGTRPEPEAEKPAKAKKPAKQPTAHLGLCLEVNDTRHKPLRFKPVILPRRKDGSLGAIKTATPSVLEKYDIQNAVPDDLRQFVFHLHHITAKGAPDHSRLETLNQVYFERLCRLAHQWSGQLALCQLEESGQNEFHSLKTIIFKTLHLRFAPYEDMENLRFWLEFTGLDNQREVAGLDFTVCRYAPLQSAVFFTTIYGQHFLALPRDPAAYENFFLFLESVEGIAVDDLPEAVKAFRHIESEALQFSPKPLTMHLLDVPPEPVLKILEPNRREGLPVRLEMEFDYWSGYEEYLNQHPDIQLAKLKKNKDLEFQYYSFLDNDPMLERKIYKDPWKNQSKKYYFLFQNDQDLEWLLDSGPQYLERGFKIYSERQQEFVESTGSSVRLDFSTGIRWLEFMPLLHNSATGESFDIDLDTFSPDELSIKDRGGSLHLLDKQDIEKLMHLARFAQRSGNGFRVPSENYFLINTLYDKRMEKIPAIKDKLRWTRKLKNFQEIPEYPVSPNFNGTLREYQDAGYRWLRFLHQYRLNGCLADDMGLGKTVQTLALLQSLKDERILSTSLLVVPVSAIPNWEAEIQKFTPSITFKRHIGQGRDKNSGEWKETDLVITSYTTMRNDIELLGNYPFDYIILDESQHIKNLNSQVSKAAKILNGQNRLALSGTPIENTSLELWSLFDFLMPGFLGTQQWFKKEWALPVEKQKDDEKTELLKRMIYPFILRRKKEEVEKQLPEKTELVVPLQMEEAQRHLYIETAQFYSGVLSRVIDENGVSKSAIKIIEGMLRLRQVCLFPRLIDPEHKDIPSVKFDHFREMLEDILAEGHKVLIFSQFVKVLHILREFLDEKEVKYCYLDGSIDAGTRGKQIKAFQEDENIGVFLLSLKAGGVAINLTAADYVIIFDPWWNPAVEAQAIDRSHRIGQTRKVIVYRMVVKDTIEQKMLALQDKKRELVEQLITSETKMFKDLTPEDILDLFQFS